LISQVQTGNSKQFHIFLLRTALEVSFNLKFQIPGSNHCLMTFAGFQGLNNLRNQTLQGNESLSFSLG